MSGQSRRTDVVWAASEALRLERYIFLYAISALVALSQFIISPDWHPSCLTDKTSCLATNKANLERPQSLAVQLSFGGSTVCQGRRHVVAQPVGPEFVGPEKGRAT